MDLLKGLIKKFLPAGLLKFIRPFYHGSLAILASLIFGQPSKKMVVVGVTGTSGKSTTVKMLSEILNSAGRKCGYITTVDFFNGENEILNSHGLSMPGGFLLQKQLQEMVKKGCEYGIVECTSEGLAQNRHLGINFDIAIFTNLTPAHLDAHNGFENYKEAKGKLFATLEKSENRKTLLRQGFGGQVGKSELGKDRKVIIINADDANAEYFASFKVDRKIKCGVKNQSADFVAKDIKTGVGGIDFSLFAFRFSLSLIGEFNITNALLAIASANVLGVSIGDCSKYLESFKGAQGRMEEIENNLGIKLFVDYAPEPAGMKAALETVNNLPHNKIIHVFGSTGGHRDVGKRFEFGRISAEFSDHIIITNDDVYDSDPKEIAYNIVAGIKEQVSRKIDYKIILDRRQAIARALSLARKNDIVIITGKGSEQFLVLPGDKRINWDDREAVKEELVKLALSSRT